VTAAARPSSAGTPTVADVQSFVDALDGAQAMLRTVADRALGELGAGLTTTQLRLLDRLQRLGESRLIDLAEALSIAPSTATRLCDTLADRQLIVRHRRGRDRRELQIKLTDTGTRLLDGVRARTTAGWEEALSRISADERRKVAVVLRRLGEQASGGTIASLTGPPPAITA
jgi:DNA-binding MarR family transcriptional regulator